MADLVVTSALTSADVSLTSGTRSPDETDGAAGSVTHSIFVRFTSNFVHLHPLSPLQERVMSRFSLLNFFLPKFQLDGNLTKSLTGREMKRKQGLEEAEIQKVHTTAPEHLTDDKLLLSTLCAEGLARKHSGGWDNDRSGVAPEAPGCLSKLPVSPSSHKWAPRSPSSMRTLDSEPRKSWGAAC